MDVQNFSFNPLTLSTAWSACQNDTYSPLKKIYKTATGAVYDLYIKNPYDLTVGNCKALINSTEQQSTKTKIAIITTVAFSSFYTLMLYGTTFHLQGRCLLALESKTRIATLVKVGEAVKKLGTNLFVAGAIPIYSLFYALPKYTFLSLPKIAQFAAAKISLITHWIFQNILNPLWDKLLVPAAQMIARLFHFVASKIEIALKGIEKAIASLSKMIFKYVLEPLWTYILFPSLKGFANVVHVIVKTFSSAIITLATKMADTIQYIFQNLITPLWQHIFAPLIQIISKSITYLMKGISHVLWIAAQKVAQFTQWAFQYLMTPLWNTLVFPVLKTIGHAIHFVAKVLLQSLQELAYATVKVALFIFQNLIFPVCKGIAYLTLATKNFLGHYVVKPLASILMSVAEKVGGLFKAIFDSVILPTAKGVASSASVLKDSILDIKTEVWQTLTSVWNQAMLHF